MPNIKPGASLLKLKPGSSLLKVKPGDSLLKTKATGSLGNTLSKLKPGDSLLKTKHDGSLSTMPPGSFGKVASNVKPGNSLLKPKPNEVMNVTPTHEEPKLFVSPPKELPKSVQKHSMCAVACCKRPYPKGTQFHRFPKDERCKLWVQACKRNDEIKIKTAKVCSQHFTRNDYQRNLKYEFVHHKVKMELIKTAVPTQKLYPGQQEEGVSEREIRHRRRGCQNLEEIYPNDQICGEVVDDTPNELNMMEDIMEDTMEEKLLKSECKVQELEQVVSELKAKVTGLQKKNSRLRMKKKLAPISEVKKKEMV